MRFGVCTGVEDLTVLERAGWDYLEPPLTATLQPEQPEEAVMPPLLARLANAHLRAETYNLLLPGDLRVVGPDVDPGRQERYLDTAFRRAALLGGKVAVFGSGGSRRIPPGLSLSEAWGQTVGFLRRAGQAAARHGIVVAIEPLNRRECNHIVSVAEAVALAEDVQEAAVGVLADLYHIAEEGQSFAETRQAGTLLKHVHVAGARDRRAPSQEDEEFLKPFFRAVQESGYQGRVSVEGQWTDLAGQAGEVLQTLRRAWEDA